MALPRVKLFVNAMPLLLANVIALMVSSGISRNDVQLENMFCMLTTAVVLNNGTDCNDVQPLNMVFMAVTDAVLNNGTVCKDTQF